MEVIASAPGKVFVVGEYAVIGGGPAVVAAVSRRLRTRVRARPGAGELTVRAGDRVVRCALATERVTDVAPEARFVAAAALVSARALDLTGVDLEIDTASELDRGPAKAGLGGSAAATAATVCALHGLAAGRRGGSAADEQARIAAGVYAHRLAQGGGSGGDVIAATAGGLVWVDGLDGRDVPRDVAACVARLRDTRHFAFERLELPPGLALEVVSCRRSCATGPRVARYAARLHAPAGTGDGVRAWADGMAAAVASFREGCQSGDAGLVQWSVARAGALLSRLGALAAIPVYTPELRRACALASGPARGAAKPSGAGGGDCAIALVAERDRTYLRERWREAGLDPLAVDLDRAGACREVTT